VLGIQGDLPPGLAPLQLAASKGLKVGAAAAAAASAGWARRGWIPGRRQQGGIAGSAAALQPFLCPSPARSSPAPGRVQVGQTVYALGSRFGEGKSMSAGERPAGRARWAAAGPVNAFKAAAA
jgi:hypothetical protein